MSMHHCLTDLRKNYFSDYVLPLFQTSCPASLRFCLWAKLTSNLNCIARDTDSLALSTAVDDTQRVICQLVAC